MKILAATTNPGKLREIKKSFSSLDYQIVSLSQSPIDSSFEAEEVGKTFRDNAIIKAKTYGDKSGLLTIADDSGLEVDALGGKPGVESKRFGQDDQDRIDKLLKLLEKIPHSHRTARFTCVAAIYDPKSGQVQTTQGIVKGHISTKPLGTTGFGYDPVFIPAQGNGKTFAQLGLKFKNQISHRAQAFHQAKALLK